MKNILAIWSHCSQASIKIIQLLLCWQVTVTIFRQWAVVVAQLVARLLPTSEISSLNPVISKFYFVSFAFKKAELKRRK